MTVSPIRIHHLKQDLLADCRRIADDLGCDLEGEMIRRGLCSTGQARLAANGEVPRVSLVRLFDFTMELRERVWDRLAGMADDYEAHGDGHADIEDDDIPY